MSRFSSAAYAWMKKHDKKAVSTDELWQGLCESNPDLTMRSETRKTPRTTCMRDLRKDLRFVVGNRQVSLVEDV